MMSVKNYLSLQNEKKLITRQQIILTLLAQKSTIKI